MNTKQLTILLGILIAFGVILVAVQASMKKSISTYPTPSPTSNVVCTMDAKMCPDGSYVGRVAPDCQFAQCPVGTPTNNPSGLYEVSLGQKAGGGTLSITPFEVVEDSRCPLGVQCIQAGTVRVKAYVMHKGATTTEIMKFDTPLNVGSTTATLTKVMPIASSTVKILSKDYRFTFNFVPR